MSISYRDVPTPELVRMWEDERERLLAGDGRGVLKPSDYDHLLAMRRELDHRRGDVNPSVEVNFERDYLTD